MKEFNMKEFKTQLRELRKSRGLTIVKFAAEIGVSRATVDSWESQKVASCPGPKNIKKLMDFYNVKLDLPGRIVPRKGKLGGMLAERIAEYRVKLNISQEEMSRRMGLERSIVSQWESTGRLPSHENIEKIARFFGITVEELEEGLPENEKRPGSAYVRRSGKKGFIGVGENIRKYRVRAGLSQDDLARILNVHQAVISSWERGNSAISVKHAGKLEQLAEVFGVSVNELIGIGREEELRSESEFRKIIAQLHAAISSLSYVMSRLIDIADKKDGAGEKNGRSS